MNAVLFKGAVKRFGQVKAVDGVDLSVSPGAVFGLVGPNGAGKTTLLALACGWLRPTSGHIEVLGDTPWRAARLKGRIAALPQDAALPPNVSLRDSLTYYARLQGFDRGRATRETDRVLDSVGLSNWRDTKASHLSHGMTKRAGIAQALIGNPELIFLDEPTAGLDPKSAYWVRSLIMELRGKTTVVVSSHNLTELETLCDTAAILHHGRVVSKGTMGQLTAADSEVILGLANSAKQLPALAEAAESVAGVIATTVDASTATISVQFASKGSAPEETITCVLSALIEAGARIGSVRRGRGLEQKVLAVT